MNGPHLASTTPNTLPSPHERSARSAQGLQAPPAVRRPFKAAIPSLAAPALYDCWTNTPWHS